MKVYKFKYNVKQYKHDSNLSKNTSGNINFNIMLTNTIDDIGILNLNIYEWSPGMKSYGGDIITYGGNTYLNVLDSKSFTTGKWDEDKKGVKELKDIKTFLNKADMYIINIVFKVFRQNPDLKDIKIYKKTADKIKHLLKETGKISESYDLF